VLRNPEGLVLMAHRSPLTHVGGVWGFPGGALELDETPVDAALREAAEELGIPGEAVEVSLVLTGTDHTDWRYSYVLATLHPAWPALELHPNWENEEVAWVTLAGIADLPLHPDLRVDLPVLLQAWSEPPSLSSS